MTALIERNLYKGITGYRKRPEDGQGFVINTKRGDILLQIAEIAERDYAFPIWYTNLVTLPVRIWPHNTGQRGTD